MIEREILVDSIRTDRRQRQLGDIEALAKSIADIGLLHPISVAPDTELIFGLRRLAAVRLLGWPTIPSYVVDNVDDAAERLLAERDDDTERRPMLRSETVALGRLLEWLDGPDRRSRAHNGAIAARAVRSGRAHTVPPAPAGLRSNHRIAQILGWSSATYSRARHIVITAATHPDSSIRAFACEQLAFMDNAGNVNRPYSRLRPLTRAYESPHGLTGQSSPLVGLAAQRKALDAALLSFRGVTDGLARIADIDERISADEAAQWVDGLAESRRIIERTINRLRQHTTKGNAT